MWQNILGTVSSVATLILFVIYFIGRTIATFQSRGLYSDKLAIEGAKDFDHAKYDVIETVILEEDAYNVFVIISSQGIWNLKIFQYEFDDEMNVVGEHLTGKFLFLNIGEAIAIKLTVPEIISTYRVEYISYDYKKIKFDLCDNMRNGVMSQIVTPRHTFRSLVYYFFR
ncbi:hypothetical protein [Pseudoflavonifractor sp. An85]|uniref:hypothetical protein n=1 Tax=Pseudoflavonifractor sp. An85 TaxID=1965661 RepID=UPI000B369BC4|nr:hypothetical protein [Pseudoflavonifractor sp. An85]OUN21948.1 hypothetical protein B5G37_10580 [Pseudoflavonifractor sp. An85]